MGECSTIRIERLENGYEVTVPDPKIAKANKKQGSVWQDPDKSYAFTDSAKVVAFVKQHLESVMPEQEFSDAFDTAAKGDK